MLLFPREYQITVTPPKLKLELVSNLHIPSIWAGRARSAYTQLYTNMVVESTRVWNVHLDYAMKECYNLPAVVKNKKGSPHEGTGQPQMYCNTEATHGEAEASFTPPQNSKIILTAVGLCPIRAVKL